MAESGDLVPVRTSRHTDRGSTKPADTDKILAWVVSDVDKLTRVSPGSFQHQLEDSCTGLRRRPSVSTRQIGVVDETTQAQRLNLPVLNVVVSVGDKEHVMMVASNRLQRPQGLLREGDSGAVLSIHLDQGISSPD